MKTFFAVMALLLSTSSMAQAQETICDTTYREGDLFILLKNIDKDTLLMLERMASYHFHELINQHRVNKKKKTIYWDDKLWLASRNHNVFMMQNLKYLSHTEAKSKPYYSGKNPENRVDYVTYFSREYKLGGFENIASLGEMVPKTMNLRAFEGLSTEELIEKSKGAAEQMFDIWKHSPGHNQNMLDGEHLASGTSIIFGDEAEYGCSVFTQKQKYYAPDVLDLNFLGADTTSFERLYKEDKQKTEPYPKVMNRIEYKLFASLTQHMNAKSIEPDKQLYKLAAYEQEHPEDKRSTNKKYRKLTHQLGLFRLMGHALNKREQSYTLNPEQFYSLAGVQKIEEFLTEKGSLISTAEGWGGFVKVAPENGAFKVTFTVYTITKKK